MGLDVTWEAEFAQAGWAEPWTGANKAKATNGTLQPALQTAIWKGKLYAVPDNSNTQLLWYRSDLVPKPPTTWAQMLADAEQLAKAGKPHLIEIQGAQYEGATVWFNTMVASAGGTILNPDATKVTLGAPAVKALSIMKQLAKEGKPHYIEIQGPQYEGATVWLNTMISSAGGSILNASASGPSLGAPTVKALSIMKQLADSPAADPSLSVQMENQNRLAMEAGTAAFELNYPFVYPSMKSDNPTLFKNFKWALYPEVTPGVPAKVTIGGVDLAVSTYSQHKDLAFQAALCLRDKQNQIIGANVGGVPPTIASLYNDPALYADYPFHADVLTELENASVRPQTPLYQVVSIDLSHQISPATAINPQATEQSMVGQITNALASKGLVP